MQILCFFCLFVCLFVCLLVCLFVCFVIGKAPAQSSSERVRIDWSSAGNAAYVALSSAPLPGVQVTQL